MPPSRGGGHHRALAGQPPLEYLIAWRMHRAAYELRTTTRSVASVGAAVGYPAERGGQRPSTPNGPGLGGSMRLAELLGRARVT